MTTAFVLENTNKPEYQGIYLRLVDGRSESEKDLAIREAIKNPDCGWFYPTSAADFKKIPGSPIIYWASKIILALFENSNSLSDKIETREGLTTGSNDLFLRLWYEVELARIGFGTENNDVATKKTRNVISPMLREVIIGTGLAILSLLSIGLMMVKSSKLSKILKPEE